MAFLIGGGVGYVLGVQGFGQKVQSPPVQPAQQQNFGPGPKGQQQGGNIQQPLNQGEAAPGAPGGRNPAPNQNGTGAAPPYDGAQNQPLPQQSGQPAQ